MNALEVIQQFVSVSGRDDYIPDGVTPSAQAWFLANSAQRWLDRELGHGKEDAWLIKSVPAGSTIISFTQCRFVKGVYVYNATTGTKTAIEWKTAFHDFDSTEQHWPYKAIEIAPSTLDRTIYVLATWYSPELTNMPTGGYTSISTIEGLQAINGSGKYSLTCDIDASGYAFTPIPAFSGILDGQGFTVSGLEISAADETPAAFITQLYSGGVIKNITFADATIESESGSASVLVYNNRGTIHNCVVSGTIETSGENAGTGGLCSQNLGAITYSKSHVSVSCANSTGSTGCAVGQNAGTIAKCEATGDVTTAAGGDVGGFVGWNNGTISNCSATGAVSGPANAGGFCGIQVSGYITKCYSRGVVEAETNVGGFCGVLTDGSITKSYYSDLSGQDDTGKGTLKLDSELQVQDTYDDWDFEEIWTIETGYPTIIPTTFTRASELSVSFWTSEHPDVLVRAMQMQAEVDMRNTQGVNDFLGPLKNDVQQIYFDLISEEMAGTTQEWRMQ